MDVLVDDSGKHFFLRVGENINFENAARFRGLLEEFLHRPDAKDLLVDFAEVQYICSSAIGSLIVLFRHIRNAGRQVFVITPHSKLFRIFELVHIQQMVTLVENPDRAYEIMDSPGTEI